MQTKYAELRETKKVKLSILQDFSLALPVAHSLVGKSVDTMTTQLPSTILPISGSPSNKYATT